MHKKLLLLSLTCTMINSAYALSEKDKNNIVTHLIAQKMPVKPTGLEQWLYNSSNMQAMICIGSHEKIQKHLKSIGKTYDDVRKVLHTTTGLYGAFTYSNGRKHEQICQSIADNGIKPYCVASYIITDYMPAKKYVYPSRTLVIASGKKYNVSLSARCAMSYEQKDGNMIAHFNQNYDLTINDILSASTDVGIVKVQGGGIVFEPMSVPHDYQAQMPILVGDLKVKDIISGEVKVITKYKNMPLYWNVFVEPKSK